MTSYRGMISYTHQYSKEETSEYAVMVDTYRPLKPIGVAAPAEMSAYKDSWREPGKGSHSKSAPETPQS